MNDITTNNAENNAFTEYLRERYPETIGYLPELVKCELSTLELSDVEKEKISDSLSLSICDFFAGFEIYFPKRGHISRMKRNNAIQKDSEELSIGELAVKYKLTERHVSDILKQQGRRGKCGTTKAV